MTTVQIVPPLVSVVMPAYNAGTWVLEGIESVLRQTVADLELIVIDDGSSDRTVELIGRVMDPRFRLIEAPHSGLPAAVRNRAAAECRGAFIAFLDSDDQWLKHKIEAQLARLERQGAAGLVHTAAHHLVEGSLVPQPSRCPASGLMPPAASLDHLLVRNFIYLSSVMMRREVLDAVRWFDADPRIRGVEDYDLWLRLCETGVVFDYLEEPLLIYNVRPDSLCRDPVRDLRCTAVAIEKAIGRRPDLYERRSRLVRKRLHLLHRDLGICEVVRGLPAATEDLLRSLKLAPLSARSWAWLLFGFLGFGMSSRILRWRRALLKWMSTGGRPQRDTPTGRPTRRDVGR
jgi:glycosyltransferase involved in cell wall biosynthesis